MERQHYQTADVATYALLKQFVKELRSRRPTEAESILWRFLRDNDAGVHFRRQHIIGQYIADFCCLKSWLIVELDGGYHNLPQQQIDDATRTAWLEKEGYRVIRFTNEEVINDPESVVMKIKANL